MIQPAPYRTVTSENHDTSFAYCTVFDGESGHAVYRAKYRLGDRTGCADAGRRAENAIALLQSQPLVHSDWWSRPIDSEVPAKPE